MSGKSKKGQREKDLTSRYFSGRLDEDRMESSQRFSRRNANAQHDRMQRTTLQRALAAAESDATDSPDHLPIGEVVQVFSLYSEVQFEGKTYLAVIRKTLSKMSDT